MGYTADYFYEVGRRIAADEGALEEARRRLALVRSAAGSFHGALRTYRSGSLAHHTMTAPVTDGDGGLVLDRRLYPKLGPEGGGETPLQITEQLRQVVGDVVRKDYPRARVTTSKRGPLVRFASPVNGQDPTVDMVVALTRRDGPGLWIPNLQRNSWEASDPEAHVKLLSAGAPSLVATRRKVIRLLKVWNKRFAEPAFFSFHLAVLTLIHLGPGMGTPQALATVFDGAAKDFRAGRTTPDPAGVSANLRPETSTTNAADRMTKAGGQIREALAHDNDRDAVAAALAGLFPAEVLPWWGRGYANAMTLISAGTATTSSVGVAGLSVPLIPTRAYGEQPA